MEKVAVYRKISKACGAGWVISLILLFVAGIFLLRPSGQSFTYKAMDLLFLTIGTFVLNIFCNPLLALTNLFSWLADRNEASSRRKINGFFAVGYVIFVLFVLIYLWGTFRIVIERERKNNQQKPRQAAVQKK